jgi:NADPH:quinone reductase-like Zn-dependent oxidoreductase
VAASGEWLLVHAGAGGVGTAAIQLGRARGARIVAMAGAPEKVELCRDQGADVAVDYRRGDFVAAALEATGGRGVDVVFDPVGGNVFARSLECRVLEGASFRSAGRAASGRTWSRRRSSRGTSPSVSHGVRPNRVSAATSSSPCTASWRGADALQDR